MIRCIEKAARSSILLTVLWVCVSPNITAAQATLGAARPGSPAKSATSPRPPRLAVLLAIDGLPMWQLLAYRHQLSAGGFARLMNQGAWFAQAHYSHAYTVTCSGHAVMLTGVYPQYSGIVGNEWRDPTTGHPRYCADDPGAKYIGHATMALDGTSPRHLRVPTVGDQLRQASPSSRVVSVSGKDRGAIMTAGHRGHAYMYMAATGEFSSSSYYMKAHPSWVDAFNATRPTHRYFRQAWQPLLPSEAYAGSLTQQPWQPQGANLPMALNAPDDEAPGPRFYSLLLRTPFIDEVTLAFALAAVEGEQLGHDSSPDILSVSLSAHDYVNHAFSARSVQSHDHLLHVDRMLAKFWQALDKKVGHDNWLVVLTSDHGFTDNPQYLAQRGQPSGRFDVRGFLDRANQLIVRHHGQGQWLLWSANGLLVNRALTGPARLDPSKLIRLIIPLAAKEPGVHKVWSRDQLLKVSNSGEDRQLLAARRSFHPDESPDLILMLRRGWMMGGGVATHGSHHSYDTHVPLMWWGPAWARSGQIKIRADMADLAPTLSRILAVPPPPSHQGRTWDLRRLRVIERYSQ